VQKRQAIPQGIAIFGSGGMTIDCLAERYRLKVLSGKFSGLHLLTSL